MNRFWHRVCLCVALFSGMQAAFTQTNNSSVSNVVSKTSDAVVLIVTSDSAGKELSLGSGFIVSGDGKIVTNYHVVKGAHAAIARLSNGASFAVEGLLAADSGKDLAVLKVAGRNLPHLDLVDSADLLIGDHVVAIGSPLGLEGSVSDGIVSAIRDQGIDKKWIQTTAPVSHGNSGGPLLDMKGNVVGVITWGVNLDLGQNLNFALPSEAVRAVLTKTHDVQPFESAKSEPEDRGPQATHRISEAWTSMTSGKDYRIRREGDYIYTDWVNMPQQLQGTPAFSRSELKKDADGHWRGKSTSYLPFQYKDVWTGQVRVNWCRVELPIEIATMSDSRIEGSSTNWEKFDAKKCEPKDPKPSNFTWIPKN